MLRVAALVTVATATLLLANRADAAVWTMPLERHARASANDAVNDAYHRFMDANTNERGSVWEPVFPHSDQGVMSTHDSVPIDFRYVGLGAYVANLFIGTPPQSVSLGLALSSSDFFVYNHKVDNHAFYDHSKSSTYQANGTQVQIGKGQPYEVDGFVSKDHVSLGGADASAGRIKVRDQPLVELTGPDTFLTKLPFDGFIGLGHGPATTTTGAPSIVRLMIDQQLLDLPVVGLAFDLDVHAMVGGIAPKYTDSDVHYFAQNQSVPWTVPVRGIKVGGKRIVVDIGSVRIDLIDSMWGPADQVDALADAVGAENYALPCDGPGPDLTFELGDGFHVTFTKKEYAIPQGQGWCKFAFFPSPLSDWMLGLPFLRRVYTVLDFGASEGQERVGFAHVKP